MESGQQGDNQKPSQRVVRGRGASRRMEAPAGDVIAASSLVQTPGGSGTEPRCGDQAGAGGGRGRVVRGRGAVRRMEARTHNTGGEAGRRSPTPTSVNRCGDGGGAAGGGDNGSGGARRVRGRGSVRRMGRDDDGRVVRGRGAVRQMEARTQTAANSSSNHPVAQGRTVRGRGAVRRMEATAGSTPAAGPAVSRYVCVVVRPCPYTSNESAWLLDQCARWKPSCFERAEQGGFRQCSSGRVHCGRRNAQRRRRWRCRGGCANSTPAGDKFDTQG